MIDSRHKILAGLLVAALIYIIFLQGCGKQINEPTETIISIDTVLYETVYDTTWHDTTTFKYITVKVPIPYYDTTFVYESVYSANDFDQIMKHPSIYEDSMIQDDTVHLSYRATVRGYLDHLEIGYKIVSPFVVSSTTTIATEITKIKQPISFYMGLDAGANASGPTYFAPMAEIVTPRMSFNGGFDIINKSVIVGIRTRISFRKKAKILPRP